MRPAAGQAFTIIYQAPRFEAELSPGFVCHCDHIRRRCAKPFELMYFTDMDWRAKNTRAMVVHLFTIARSRAN